MLRPMRFAEVTLSAPLDVRDFYGGELELPLDGDAIAIGETRLRFDVEEGGAFYHFALLVPGDRFAAALEWAQQRVDLLGDVFEFENWDAEAVYFHDPAGSIVELIAHHGLEESGRSGPFAAAELVGFSELGIVGDRKSLLGELETEGLELWSGTVGEPDRLAFVGEKGRTLILAPPGRGWLPTNRPAEPHPVEYRLEL
jgi:D-alanyl-D-alanine carboxypeptidase